MLSESSNQYKNDKNKIIRKCSNSKNNMFQEAIDHCRWKKVLHNVLENNIILQNYTGKSFEEILVSVYNICENVEGIGMLTVYDITSAICRYHKVNIDKVYIIGGGPKRAIRLLNIEPKIHKIEQMTLKYVEIPEIIQAFDDQNLELEPRVKNSNNGDVFETYICIWQKSK